MTDAEQRLMVALTRLLDARRLIDSSGLDVALPHRAGSQREVAVAIFGLIESVRHELRKTRDAPKEV